MLFDSREEAVEMEIKLHEKFDVGLNESFYNRVKQSNTIWHGSGEFSVIDTETGKNLRCKNDDPHYISGRYVSVNKGNTHSEEARQKMSEAAKGKSRPKSKEARMKLSNSLKGKPKSEEHKKNLSKSREGMIQIRDTETGEVFPCKKDDPHYLSGRYVGVNKGHIPVINTQTGETTFCSVDHPLFVSGVYVGVNKGRKFSEESRKKMSEAQKGKHKGIPKPKVKCEYCDMESSKTNIDRWHNENCKHKPKED